mgnify:CR=1 FL=1
MAMTREFTGFTYRTGEVVQLGDRIEVRRFLRRPRRGRVVKIYDPSRPSPPWGDNDFGYGIEVEDGTWGLANSDDPTITFIGRAEEQEPG